MKDLKASEEKDMWITISLSDETVEHRHNMFGASEQFSNIYKIYNGYRKEQRTIKITFEQTCSRYFMFSLVSNRLYQFFF